LEAIEVRPDDGFVVVALSGELDVADAEWSETLEKSFRDGTSRLVLDLTNVTFIDSSVVRELVLAHRRVGPGGWVRLVYTHHLIARVIDICGLADTFPQYATVDAARRAAPTRAAAATLRVEAAVVAANRRDAYSGEHHDGT